MSSPNPTPLALIQRFYIVGVTDVAFFPTIANKNTPTVAELTAGTLLTKHVRAIDGFQLETGDVDANDISDDFENTISGRSSVGDASLLIYGSKTGLNDARSLLAAGIRGFIGLAPGGLKTASKFDLFPVQVKPHGKVYDDSAAFHMRFAFNVYEKPAIDVTVP